MRRLTCFLLVAMGLTIALAGCAGKEIEELQTRTVALQKEVKALTERALKDEQALNEAQQATKQYRQKTQDQLAGMENLLLPLVGLKKDFTELKAGQGKLRQAFLKSLAIESELAANRANQMSSLNAALQSSLAPPKPVKAAAPQKAAGGNKTAVKPAAKAAPATAPKAPAAKTLKPAKPADESAPGSPPKK